jgi:hypothetical protein
MAQIDKPNLHFNAVLNTATGTQSITGVNFQPDLLWLSTRSSGANPHLMDAVRGSSKILKPSQSNAEGTNASFITSFDSDGFSLGSANWSDSRTVVNWCWKANGSGSANTDGSTSSTVSANTTAGFSIFKFTGTNGNTTVGHGLGAAPEMFIIKNTAQAGHWMVYHKDLQSPAGKQMYLNLTNAQASDTGWLQNTAPSSSVITLGANADSNGSGNIMIGWAFRSIKGYSKIGKYQGNGTSDGTFVYCGFRPALVLFKVGYASAGSDFTGNWQLLDNRRTTSGGNHQNQTLYPNSNIGDQNEGDIDILSNGFKLRSTGNDSNSSSGVYMYYAIAENPLVANVGQSIPATAR